MELSETEKRLLQEMESHLLSEDPKFATSLAEHRPRLGLPAVLAGSGMALGAVLMGLGVWRAQLVGISIALSGFVVLLGSTTALFDQIRARRESPVIARTARRARRPS